MIENIRSTHNKVEITLDTVLLNFILSDTFANESQINLHTLLYTGANKKVSINP